MRKFKTTVLASVAYFVFFMVILTVMLLSKTNVATILCSTGYILLMLMMAINVITKAYVADKANSVNWRHYEEVRAETIRKVAPRAKIALYATTIPASGLVLLPLLFPTEPHKMVLSIIFVLMVVFCMSSYIGEMDEFYLNGKGVK